MIDTVNTGPTAIVIVSGLPRSGTSLMMKMLEAGGIPPLTDAQRAADDDNPQGYYEFERVKAMPKGDVTWLAEAQGRAVKVISALLPHLPPQHRYQVLFMRRQMAEVLASQRAMLVRRGEQQDGVSDTQLAAIFEKHLRQVFDWVALQPNIVLLEVDYNALIAEPQPGAEQVAAFLARPLDVTQMAAAVDPGLYRNRG